MDSSDESDEEFVLPFTESRRKGPLLPTAEDIICEPHEYAFDALSNFVLEISQRVMADVLKVLYSQEYILSDGGSMSVYMFCLARAKMSRYEIRKKFGKFGDVLVCDLRGREKVDVNFGYQVMVELCGSAFDSLSKECRGRIKSLKDCNLKILRKFRESDKRYPREVRRYYQVVRRIYKLVGREFDEDFRSSLEKIRCIRNEALKEKQKIPLEKRANPFEKPTGPSEKPTGPSEKPTGPSKKPTGPFKKPTGPFKKPTGPFKKPTGPFKKPTGPFKIPTGPFKKPTGPFKIPTGPFKKPTCVDVENVLKSTKPKKKKPMVTEAFSDLKRQYQKLEVSNPFIWLDEAWYHRIVHYQSVKLPANASEQCVAYIKTLFAPLKVVDTGANIDVKDLLTTRKRVGGGEAEATALLVSGEAGSGKTALCYHIAQEWSKKKTTIAGLSDFDLVLLLEHCKVESQGLAEYLKKRILRETWRKFADKDILPFLKGLDVLFILDGFDEATERTFRVVQDTLEHFSKKRILITTQPECEIHPDLLALLWANHIDFQRLEVLELDDASQEAVAEVTYERLFDNRLESEKKKSDFLEYYYNECGSWTGRVTRYPVTSALYMAQWEEYGAETRTVTELHDAFFRLCLNKLVDRKACDPSSSEEVLKPLLPVLLGEVAWEMLKQKKHTVYGEVLDHFKEMLMGLKVDHYEVLLAFLDCTFDRTKIPYGMTFSFINTPQQEYYAAKYLANRILSYELAVHYFHRERVDWKKFSQVLMFLVGQLVAQDSSNAILQQVLGLFYDAGFPADDYVFWWNLYVESGGHDCVRYFIAKTALPKSHWVLDADNVVLALTLLCSIPVELRSLKIDIAVDPHRMPDLLSLMEDLPDRLQDRYGKSKTIEVDLHFRQHFEEGGLYPSDKFLLTLRPWGTLVNFTGELGERQLGRDVILDPWHLRTLSVRVSTPEALCNLRDISTHLTAQCSAFRLAVGLTRECDPQSIPSLDNPFLELLFQDVLRANRLWVVATIKSLGGRKGAWRVYINNCTLSPEDKAVLAVRLSHHIRDKLTIRGGDAFNDVLRRALAKCLAFRVSLI